MYKRLDAKKKKKKKKKKTKKKNAVDKWPNEVWTEWACAGIICPDRVEFQPYSFAKSPKWRNILLLQGVSEHHDLTMILPRCM